MRIPGPEHQDDGGVSAVAAAGGLHRYQLRLHEAHGPVVRFQLPGAGTVVSVADPVLLEATAHIDKRPDELFAFLDPLCEAGNLQVLPADEHTPYLWGPWFIAGGMAFAAAATHYVRRHDGRREVRLYGSAGALGALFLSLASMVTGIG